MKCSTTAQRAADWHLRVTVLPQCNLRCRYCNPLGVFEHSPTLDDSEILEIVEAGVECGIERVHWTGGEPCIRNMPHIIRRSKELGMREQIMTTNGTLRLDDIDAMKEAGLGRVNISLDSLDPEKNCTITGKSHFETTMAWMHRACEVFDLETKMNIVAMRDNVCEVPHFVAFAQGFGGKLALKFIELCPNNPAFYGSGMADHTTSRKELIDALASVGSLHPSSIVGDNPNAECYLVGDTGVKVILVTMPSQAFNCGLDRCRKLRVSPFGLAGSCIQQKGIPLLGKSHVEKVDAIQALMRVREAYPDTPPVTRTHLRRDYGIWRFGAVGPTGGECQRT